MRTKVGGLDVVIKPQLLDEIRAAAMASEAAKKAKPSVTSIAKEIRPLFQQIKSESSMLQHATTAFRSPQFAIDGYKTGKISYGALSEIAVSNLSEAMIVWLCEKAIEYSLSPGEIQIFKARVRAGESVDLAMKRARGIISENSRHEDLQKSVKEFGPSVDEFDNLCLQVMSKARFLMETRPDSAYTGKGMDLHLIEHLIKLQESMDRFSASIGRTVQRVKSEITSHLMTEDDIRSKENENG